MRSKRKKNCSNLKGQYVPVDFVETGEISVFVIADSYGVFFGDLSIFQAKGNSVTTNGVFR